MGIEAMRSKKIGRGLKPLYAGERYTISYPSLFLAGGQDSGYKDGQTAVHIPQCCLSIWFR
jgi:hypothetical protein